MQRINIRKKADGTPYKTYYSYACKHRHNKDGHKCDYRKQWSEEIETEIIRSGDLVIDVVHNMIFKKGRELSIKDTEFRLCYMLVRNDGRIMPRELLLERLWDMDEHFIENNTLSVYVSRLRKKLGVYNGVSYIETIKGIGYRWNHLVQRGEFNE